MAKLLIVSAPMLALLCLVDTKPFQQPAFGAIAPVSHPGISSPHQDNGSLVPLSQSIKPETLDAKDQVPLLTPTLATKPTEKHDRVQRNVLSQTPSLIQEGKPALDSSASADKKINSALMTEHIEKAEPTVRKTRTVSQNTTAPLVQTEHLFKEEPKLSEHLFPKNETSATITGQTLVPKVLVPEIGTQNTQQIVPIKKEQLQSSSITSTATASVASPVSPTVEVANLTRAKRDDTLDQKIKKSAEPEIKESDIQTTEQLAKLLENARPTNSPKTAPPRKTRAAIQQVAPSETLPAVLLNKPISDNKPGVHISSFDKPALDPHPINRVPLTNTQ